MRNHRKSRTFAHSPTMTWLPHHDRRLRAMWPCVWQWTMDDMAESFVTNPVQVAQRARELNLPPRPSREHDLAPRISREEVRRRHGRFLGDLRRRTALSAAGLSVAVRVVGSSAVGTPVRAVDADTRALIDEAVRRARMVTRP